MPSIDTQTGRVLKIEGSINTNCPWSGKPIDPDSLMLYKSSVIGFCNPGCRDDFARSIAFLENELTQKKASDIAEAVMFFEEILSHQELPSS